MGGRGRFAAGRVSLGAGVIVDEVLICVVLVVPIRLDRRLAAEGGGKHRYGSGVEEGGFAEMAVLQGGEAVKVNVIDDDGFGPVEEDVVPPVEAIGESEDLVRGGCRGMNKDQL